MSSKVDITGEIFQTS